jgi:DNA-directed RNA polymerase specialized sigma54-like protein
LTLREVALKSACTNPPFSRAIAANTRATPAATVPLRAFFASASRPRAGGEAFQHGHPAMIRA